MGILAESLAAYAQPLLEGTDGSIEQMNRALALAQVCWNLALLPEEARNEALRELEPSLNMEPGELEAFRRTVATRSGATAPGHSSAGFAASARSRWR